GVLKQIADGQANANDLYQAFRHQLSIHPEGSSRLYFTSNHDENSWQGTTRELFGDAAEVFAVITATFDGMPLVYSGQEAGLDKRLAFFDKDLIPWRDHPKADLYAALFHLRRENQALWHGEAGGELQRVPTSSNRNVFAFIRKKNDDQVLVAANLSGQGRDLTLEGSMASGTYRDVLTGDVVSIGEDAEIALGAWDYVVYELLESGTSSDRSGELAKDDIAGGPVLHQNYPNPFNPATTISFTLAHPAAVTVEIFDLTGRKITRLADGDRPAGRHQVTWDAADAASGIYLLKIRAGDWQEARKMTVVK
ncbi:MAG: T9SS C-terminal target domain-containing protein, partial [Balneolaceae bacterium]